MIYDVAVIGGALSGSRTAQLLAEKGKNVLLIEEHFDIGVPCKCTGLVSQRTPEMVKLPKKLIVNKLDKGRFFSPDGTFFELKSKNPAFVIDRPGLDKFIHSNAVDAGVDAKTDHFKTFKRHNSYVDVIGSRGTYQAKVIVGSDGANSLVAQDANLKMPDNIYVGMQTTARGDFEQYAELWFGKEVAPKFFAWLVPENDEVARVGLATPTSPKPYYERFLRNRLKQHDLKPDVAGVIRFGIMKDTVADNVLLVGDAACQVKPFSGGGITYGLIAAEIASDAIVKGLNQGRLDYEFFKKHYDDMWKEKIGPGINRGMLLRNILFTLSDPQMNTLFKTTKLFGHKILSTLDFDLLSG
ncbi:MAG: NAD(P)/FAD-dependent oxidoreductase [Candidatus Aenigmarchaeota archaeon]|nr:NAD(P)/FAD-dependent oxidoreductase [Candidatus Aenigmarchaeota archaeon]